VEEAKRYHLNIVGVSSTTRRGSGTVNLDGEWKLFYSGAASNGVGAAEEAAQAGIGVLTSPQLQYCEYHAFVEEVNDAPSEFTVFMGISTHTLEQVQKHGRV